MLHQLRWHISRQRYARAEADFTILEVQLEATMYESEIDSRQQLCTRCSACRRHLARQKRQEQQVFVLGTGHSDAIAAAVVASESRVNHGPITDLVVRPALLEKKPLNDSLADFMIFLDLVVASV